jgi:hypothetical protein
MRPTSGAFMSVGFEFALDEGNPIWASSDERARAKALLQEVGPIVQKNAPLGRGDLALLIAFGDGA